MTRAIDYKFLYFCFEESIRQFSPIPFPEKEFIFHETRKWRLDFAWPEHRLAVEIEGGAYTRGRHTRGKGFIEDMTKYNALTLAGWSLLRFTSQQIGSGEALGTIEKWFRDALGYSKNQKKTKI